MSRDAPSEDEDDECLEDDFEADAEEEPEPVLDEEALLKDEGHMFALIREHGREAIERVLRWLPSSHYWFGNPDRKLTSLAQLRIKNTWDLLSGDCEKYYARAVDTETESHCATHIATKFSEAGGDDAEDLCFDRLYPIDRTDAAEEEEMWRSEGFE